MKFIHDIKYDGTLSAVPKLLDLTSQVVSSIPIQDKFWYELRIIVLDLDIRTCEVYVCETPL